MDNFVIYIAIGTACTRIQSSSSLGLPTSMPNVSAALAKAVSEEANTGCIFKILPFFSSSILKNYQRRRRDIIQEYMDGCLRYNNVDRPIKAEFSGTKPEKDLAKDQVSKEFATVSGGGYDTNFNGCTSECS